MKSLFLIILLSFSLPSFAKKYSCPWLPSFERSIESVQKDIYDKTGKKPTLSCGGGKDYKVCHSCADKLSEEDWKKIQPMLAQPSYRKWHKGWHNESWGRTSPSPSKISNSDYEGEAFFYMHREMYRNVQANLAGLGLPCISPWAKLPESAEDKLWPNRAYLLNYDSSACGSVDKDGMRNIDFFESQLSSSEEALSKEEDAEIEKLREQEMDFSDFFEKKHVIRERFNKKNEVMRKNLLLKFKVSEEMLNASEKCPSEAKKRELQNEHDSLVTSSKEQLNKDYLSKSSLGSVGTSISESWHGSLHYSYGDSSPREVCSQNSNYFECDSMGGDRVLSCKYSFL